MINIKRYREWLLELKEKLNRGSEDVKVDGVVLAVHEGHLIRKLRDRRGIWLCAKYPDATVKGGADAFSTDNQMLLFLLEKVPSGQHSDEDELTHYASLQGLMDSLKTELLDGELMCDDSVRLTTNLTIEWEYDIFGGWNGLSVSFKLEDFE